MYVNGNPRYENQPVYGSFSQYEPVKMVQGVKILDVIPLAKLAFQMYF